jgi:phospho-N-acetylmuramoyl-pentapeptide-transferase
MQLTQSILNLAPVLTTASLMAGLVLVLTLLAGAAGLPLLHRLGVGQTVRDDGPKSHFVKSGTPTFGGLFFLLPITLVLSVSWLIRGFSIQELALLLLVLGFALVGFLDDYIKVRITKKGLSVGQKTVLMLAFSVLFTLFYLYGHSQQPYLLLPGLNSPVAIVGGWKLLYGAGVVVYLFFIANSVNLTDGVDGLASTVTVICSLGLAAAGLILLRKGLPAHSLLPGVNLATMIAAGCLGFLAFNRHPARVFMGDTGSQALGAAVSGVALLAGVPWLLALAGFIYIAESLSVMIQVAYFKKTGGKRIFRMSPIHHHYELGGWRENKIVLVFSAVTLAGSLAGLLLVAL